MKRPLWFMALIGLAATCSADALVTVCDSSSDAGAATSLAEAVEIGGQVTFACGPDTVIAVTRPMLAQPGTVVDGGGHVTLDAGQRPLTVFTSANGRLTLKNIRLTRGRSVQPGIGRSRPSLLRVRELTLLNVQIDASELPAVVAGDARVENSRFLRNSTALTIGGEAQVHGSTFADNDRALNVVRGRITTSTFERNRGAALRVGNAAGTVEVSGCRFAENVPRGAVEVSTRSARDGHGLVRVRKSTFSRNHHASGGGAITLVDLADEAAGFGLPDSVVNALRGLAPAHLDLGYNRFADNTGARAGALHAAVAPGGRLTVRNGLFSGNSSSSDGGAIAWSGGSIDVRQGVFRGNRAAARGGAMRGTQPASGAAWSISNTLVVMNESHSGSGALDAAFARLRNVTIADNVGWGIVMDPAASPRAEVANTIVARNTSGNCRDIPISVFRPGNVQFGASDCADVPAFDPHLDALYMPVLGSEALWTGDVSVCQSDPVSSVDLLFHERRHPARCASGAYEHPALSPATRRSIGARGVRGDGSGECPCPERPDER